MTAVFYCLRLRGQAWPGVVGGFDGWIQGRHPAANALAFINLCDELRRTTMLEL